MNMRAARRRTLIGQRKILTPVIRRAPRAEHAEGCRDASSSLAHVAVHRQQFMSPAERLSDPRLQANGFFQQVDYKYAGRHPYPSLPIRIDGSYPPINRAGPLLGEDDHYVFTQMLGLDEAELERLEKAGVIGNRPADQ